MKPGIELITVSINQVLQQQQSSKERAESVDFSENSTDLCGLGSRDAKRLESLREAGCSATRHSSQEPGYADTVYP